MHTKLRTAFYCIVTILFANTLNAQNTGMATYFEGLGEPYGGCGMPQSKLETQYFVALNTYDSPGDATNFSDWSNGEPAPADKTGEFANGKNCGRWIKVTLGPDCDGLNDGALGEDFCRGANAQWIDDQYSGAELYMIVADACPDGNAWCRDSYFHLDMSEASVSQFEKNGTPIGNDIFDHFNNRTIHWEYVKAPSYSGDISIFMMKNAQVWWPAIAVNNLENGIHKVEQLVGGQWIAATMNGLMGQSFVLNDDNGSGTYTIRIYDADDKLVNNGREYTFSLPASCGGLCSDATTETSYTTFDPEPVKTEITIDTVLLRSEFEEIGDTLAILNRGSGYEHTQTAQNNAIYQWKNGAIVFADKIQDTKGSVTKHEITLVAEGADSIFTLNISIYDAIDYFVSQNGNYSFSESTTTIGKDSGLESSFSVQKGTTENEIDFRIVTGTTENFPNETIYLWDISQSATQKGFLSADATMTFKKPQPAADNSLFPIQTKYDSTITATILLDSIFGKQPSAVALTSYSRGNNRSGSLSFQLRDNDRQQANTRPRDTTIESNDIFFETASEETIIAETAQDLDNFVVEYGQLFSNLKRQTLFSASDIIDSIALQIAISQPSFGCIGVSQLQIDTTLKKVRQQHINLTNSWNLVTIQLDLDTCVVASVFPHAEQVKNDTSFFDSSLPAHLNSLTTVKPGAPYLVKNSIAEKITLTGITIQNQTSVLSTGWNLFSGPADKPWNIEPLGTSNTYLIKNFESFGNGIGAGTLHSTEPGKAYFFYTDEPILKYW